MEFVLSGGGVRGCVASGLYIGNGSEIGWSNDGTSTVLASAGMSWGSDTSMKWRDTSLQT